MIKQYRIHREVVNVRADLLINEETYILLNSIMDFYFTNWREGLYSENNFIKENAKDENKNILHKQIYFNLTGNTWMKQNHCNCLSEYIKMCGEFAVYIKFFEEHFNIRTDVPKNIEEYYR